MKPDNDSSDVSKRLGVVIALLLRTTPTNADVMSLRDQVKTLSELGMRPKDIAEILGRTQGYVSKELVSLRKKRKSTK